MTIPSRFYGSPEEALMFECGPRVAHGIDEAFAIEKRLIDAVPGTQWRLGRQIEWIQAAQVARGDQ